MVKIQEGFTKAEAKHLVKLGKSLVARGSAQLEGLLYEASSKTLAITDGCYMVYWKMDKLREEELPKNNATIHYTKINAWCANAKAQDILDWTTLFEMAEENQEIPKLQALYSDIEDTETLSETSQLNPRFIEKVLPLFDGAVKVSNRKCNKLVVGWFVERVLLKDELVLPQYAIVMGMKKQWEHRKEHPHGKCQRKC